MFGNCEVERKALEATYEGKLFVYGYLPRKIGFETVEEMVLLQGDLPCALAKLQLPLAGGGDLPTGSYRAKVFCSPDLVIAPGSRLKIEQSGKSYEFYQSGESFVYATHQEFLVERVY